MGIFLIVTAVRRTNILLGSVRLSGNATDGAGLTRLPECHRLCSLEAALPVKWAGSHLL